MAGLDAEEGEKKTAGETLLGKPGGLTLTKKGFVRKERTMSRISHAQTAVNTEAQRGHKKKAAGLNLSESPTA